MKRRTFLKLAGVGSLSVACSPQPDKTLFSMVRMPEDMVTGMPTWYATTCRECPAGCGLLAKQREGRVIKLEGNPAHPVNRGRVCMRGQAGLQAVYHPDRLTTPLEKVDGRFRPISMDAALARIRERGNAAARKGQNRVRMLTEVVGEDLLALFALALRAWRADPPTIFEPIAYESLKSANDQVFGTPCLPTYCIDRADVLVSFGADFIDTWLSPVEYARKFKEMQAWKKGRKGTFFHFGTFRNTTAANADRWVSCRPGGEAVVVRGLLRNALAAGCGTDIPTRIHREIERLTADWTPEQMTAASGVSPEDFARVSRPLLAARRPLVLGTGVPCPNALATDIAVNLLNFLLDPTLARINFARRPRVGIADSRADVLNFFNVLKSGAVDLVFLNNVNPAYALSGGSGVEILNRKDVYAVCFGAFMDETARLADLVVPVTLPLEGWGTYESVTGAVSTIQPAMGSLHGAPHVADVFLKTAFGDKPPAGNARQWMLRSLEERHVTGDHRSWIDVLAQGGDFTETVGDCASPPVAGNDLDSAPNLTDFFIDLTQPEPGQLVFVTAPSIRFFDGRSANRPWLCEVPDPVSKVAWQSPVWIHPQTRRRLRLAPNERVAVQTRWGKLFAPLFETQGVLPDVLFLQMGQGHTACGRWAENQGANPVDLLSPATTRISGAPDHTIYPVHIYGTGHHQALARTDGHRFQEGRKIALSVSTADLSGAPNPESAGPGLGRFPLGLPPAEDHHAARPHAGYRWGMIVDLDRCVGCGACAVACYAENNIGIVGEAQIVNGREMSWMAIERYEDDHGGTRMIFLPMLCQQCDNAPCEPVCPVFATNHSKEGINNQVYNRCIGTRFCAQNCPYEVRRFNWFDWKWPKPMNLQLNPNVTVRSKGVMEKCSFCIQRIKDAHDRAKNENRGIADGEVTPACVQTCPTGALVFGNFMDPKSRILRSAGDRRAYRVMEDLNTRPAVIYLKRVVSDG